MDGRIGGVPGALPAAMAAMSWGLGLICPADCGPEATWSGLGAPDNQGIIAAEHILQLINHLRETQTLPPPEPRIETAHEDMPDMSDVRCQPEARLALEVAAAGGHNLLLTGPPGAGKSMLAARLPGILPPLQSRQRLEVTMIKSLSSGGSGVNMANHRPFRAPHHSASMAALIGGGRQAKPGEISLSHNGVLFLDELPEFSRQTLDALRQPIETGEVEIARAEAHITYPTKFQLVAAMNPCRCDHANDPELACHRIPQCINEYLARLSGPLLDRFDIRIEVPPVSLRDMLSPDSGESSADIARRVENAQNIQFNRNQGCLNAYLDGELLRDLARPDEEGQALIDKITNEAIGSKLTARGYNRIIRVARTIADLDGCEHLAARHIASAMVWRGVTSYVKG